MPDLKRRLFDVGKRWKNWLPLVAVGVGLVVVVFYVGTAIWQTVQDGKLNTLLAVLIFFAVYIPIVIVAWSYRREVLVAVVGMVVGAVAGFFPYLVIAIILMLLKLSPEGQASSRELSQLFSNEVFSQLFFVAGAASGGPIAVYAYNERKKREAENGKDR